MNKDPRGYDYNVMFNSHPETRRTMNRFFAFTFCWQAILLIVLASVDLKAHDADDVLFQERLYVGRVMVNKSQLKADDAIEIQIYGFNGNDESFAVDGVDGNIVIGAFEDGNTVPQFLLDGSELILGGEPDANDKPLSEFVIVLRHEVDPAVDLQSIVSLGSTYLDFSGLDVWISSDDAPSERARLPMPDMIRLFDTNEHFFFVGKVASIAVDSATHGTD